MPTPHDEDGGSRAQRARETAGLARFRDAQASRRDGFESALEEMRVGRKRGHWIWYVFPQLRGLGTSDAARTYAIDGQLEATAYLRDPDLRARYLAVSQAVADQLRAGRPLVALMGSDTDARKLVSSLTLFGHVATALHKAEGLDAYGRVASVADEVLTVAAAEGYLPCAYTLGHASCRCSGTAT